MLRLNSFKCQLKCLGILLFLTLLYNEQLAYYFQTFRWPHLTCEAHNERCIKILFVADPQIIGEQYNTRLFMPIARWDSDRFMAVTFKHAVRHFKPDIVVFLGDLMDEGSIAEADEYARYQKRISSIFPNLTETEYIFIPGDNDIGGEDDRVSLRKIDRFHKTFDRKDVINFKEFNFLKVNRIIHELPKSKSLLNQTNIVISHMPILFLPGSFTTTVVQGLKPAVIFAGHEHKSLHIGMSRKLPMERQVNILSTDEKPVTEFILDKHSIHEIIVPTCSYRMGVSQSGYGAAVIDASTSRLKYGVLWLPSRFKLLNYYLYLLTGFSLYALLVITYLTIAIIIMLRTKYKKDYKKINTYE